MVSYWRQYPDIEVKLQAVREFIEQRVQISNTDIESAIIAMNAAGGKYLRPAFFFMFTGFTGHKQYSDNDRITVAASLEILHMATLIHDDIIDDSPLRRGQVSVQARYGKDVAVYTGDFLFTVFFELVIETMQGSPYLAVNAQAMKKILLGELDQMYLRFNQEQTVDNYLQSCAGKTAELFRLACEEGAYFSDADTATVELAGRIGLNIGLAFQILDDILDYTAQEGELQKPVLEDLATGVYTLPLLAAYEDHAQDFKPYLDKGLNISHEDIRTVARMVRDFRGVDKARDLAKSFTQRALDDIKRLPDTPSRANLIKLTRQLLHRTR